jgi:uncharacterized protein (DUF362 family)/NAD-dependent dihydropyrimidine dehydrogenase PreA subunit
VNPVETPFSVTRGASKEQLPTRVSLVSCQSYDPAQVEGAVKRAVDLLGGIERFVKPNESVLLKPNLLTDAPPEKGIDTHPEVVRAVIRLIRPLTNHIVCGDSPSVWGQKNDINRVYEISGIKDVCEDEGVELVYFAHAKLVKGYALARWAFSCDRVINIPKFKTHGFTVLTACLKNLFGLVVGMHKMKIHFDHPRPPDLSRVIVDLYEARRPDLNIVDGIIAMEGEGPGSAGTLKPMNLIAAGSDGVALDMVLARLMNLDVLDIPTNKEAVDRGLGPETPTSIDIVGERLERFSVSEFKLPKTSVMARAPSMPPGLSRRVVSFLSLKPYFKTSKCKCCGICQKICPARAIRLKDRRMVVDRSHCILCLCCQEICPHAAIKVRKNRLLELLSRS